MELHLCQCDGKLTDLTADTELAWPSSNCSPWRGVGYRDNEKENGNYCSILGLYRDNGKENGNYYSILCNLPGL